MATDGPKIGGQNIHRAENIKNTGFNGLPLYNIRPISFKTCIFLPLKCNIRLGKTNKIKPQWT